ncbi:MAG: hypothetical protein U0840_01600 [Gemmataceae bacterium]
MLPRLLGSGLFALTAAGLLAPALAQDSAKDSAKDKPKASGKLYSIGVFAGKVLDVSEDGQSFTLQVKGKNAVPRYTPGNPRS